MAWRWCFVCALCYYFWPRALLRGPRIFFNITCIELSIWRGHFYKITADRSPNIACMSLVLAPMKRLPWPTDLPHFWPRASGFWVNTRPDFEPEGSGSGRVRFDFFEFEFFRVGSPKGVKIAGRVGFQKFGFFGHPIADRLWHSPTAETSAISQPQ